MQWITRPDRLFCQREVLSVPNPVPTRSGIYGWFFRELPGEVPSLNFIRNGGLSLLYVGICPARPSSASNRNLRNRLREHFGRAIAEGSTLRFSLGTLLGLPLYLKGTSSKGSKTFSREGEEVLSTWMEKNAFVAWCENPEPWRIEESILAEFGESLPLNIQNNQFSIA